MRGLDKILVAIAAFVAIGTTVATLHARATMAAVEADVAVLKSQRIEAKEQREEDLVRIETRLGRIERKLDRALGLKD